MYLISSIPTLNKVLKKTLFGFTSIFDWADFFYPSTLNISPLVEELLSPVEDTDNLKRIELGLHEALVNSVQHGNSGDPRKELRVRRVLTPNWFIWQIQDQGDGLPEMNRKGELPERLDAENGRGLFLIYQCFDDIRWSRKGNRLQLACRREVNSYGEDNHNPLFHV